MLDSEEARAEAGDNEKSLYHIIKPEINFEPGTSEYDPKVYEACARQRCQGRRSIPLGNSRDGAPRLGHIK